MHYDKQTDIFALCTAAHRRHRQIVLAVAQLVLYSSGACVLHENDRSAYIKGTVKRENENFKKGPKFADECRY